MNFGEFGSKRNAALRAAHELEVGKRFMEPMRCFIQHGGASFDRHHLEALFALHAGARQKTLKNKAPSGQTTQCHRHDCRRRPRRRAHHTVGVNDCTHDALARVADAGAAGISNECNNFALSNQSHDLFARVVFGVFVDDEQRFVADADVLQQLARMSRVFTADHIGFAQRLDGPRRDV